MITLDVAVYMSIRIELQFFERLYHMIVYAWRSQISIISGQTEHIVAVVFSGPCTTKEIFSYNREFVIWLTTQTDSSRYLLTLSTYRFLETSFQRGSM